MGNILNVRTSYSSLEWENREQYYAAELAKLPVPIDPGTKDILAYNAMIDSLMSEAQLDFAYISRSFQGYKTILKNAEKEIFSTIKKTELSNPTAGRVTEKDIDGMTVMYLKNNPINNLPISIYDIVMAAEKRHIFMERVIKILEDKREAIITINTMIKIENKI